jgi:hypothetical protein
MIAAMPRVCRRFLLARFFILSAPSTMIARSRFHLASETMAMATESER